MTAEKKRDTTVDVVKGICTILVIINHSRFSDSFYYRSLFPFWVFSAVPVFMFLSGYVRSLRAPDIHDAYDIRFILKQLSRLMIPFLPIFLIEEIISLHGSLSLGTVLTDILDGGHGPGSYYVSTMVQFVFLFPLVHYLIKRYDRKGLILCLGLNLFYEIFKSAVHLSPEHYRVLVFRFLFLIAWGIYFGRHREDRNISVFLIPIGILYIYVSEYLDTEILCFDQWKTVAIPAAFLWIPILMYVMKRFRFHNSLLELIGKASYHIFLIQMFYFRYIHPYLTTEIHFLGMMAVNVVVCCIVGSLYYLVEKQFRKWIRSLHKQ